MEEHVLSNWFAGLDEIRVLAWVDRKEPDGITADGTVSHADGADASVRIVDTAAGTSRCAFHTDGYACDLEGAGDFYA